MVTFVPDTRLRATLILCSPLLNPAPFPLSAMQLCDLSSVHRLYLKVSIIVGFDALNHDDGIIPSVLDLVIGILEA